jgi:hypothetical protein
MSDRRRNLIKDNVSVTFTIHHVDGAIHPIPHLQGDAGKAHVATGAPFEVNVSSTTRTKTLNNIKAFLEASLVWYAW